MKIRNFIFVLALAFSVAAQTSTSGSKNTTTPSTNNSSSSTTKNTTTTSPTSTSSGSKNTTTNTTSGSGSKNTTTANTTSSSGTKNTTTNSTSSSGTKNTTTNTTSSSGTKNTTTNSTSSSGTKNTTTNTTSGSGTKNTTTNSTSSSGTKNTTTNSTSSTSTKTAMDDYIAKFPKAVITEMSTRYMRYHHYLWHQVRENWNRFPEATKDAFKKIGWQPPNPARNYDATGKSSAVLDNYSGEEFLYMHRQMIKKANEIITKNKDPFGNVTGFKTIPAPNDKDWPVPANYTIPNDTATTNSTTNRKTDSFYNKSILPNEKIFTDPVQLRKMNLSELGARIELTVHGYIHMRWSGFSDLGYRNSYRGTIPNIDVKWDNVSYNWLGDSYASHVHPLFWKIHGWVDDRIEDWRKANNVAVIPWKGVWTGGPMENLASVGVKSLLRTTNAMTGMSRGSEGSSISGNTVMDEALQILWASGVPEVEFADDVYLPPFKK